MGRELLLGWPGRVLEPVGLAQGGLATDPVGSLEVSQGGGGTTFPPQADIHPTPRTR
ncbi:hypothetical protein D4764_01G0012810 [Takifugu flavidus]|uniref:Uncharacterized protein n=1 Tax=Takifugu flavidus TaxID=433684 RepID=A0A5C6PRB6_9TELE|nr:hypothetical protein D4764_01G0012810 [Takifugu flavidus]